jgi:hypothetical protein
MPNLVIVVNACSMCGADAYTFELPDGEEYRPGWHECTTGHPSLWSGGSCCAPVDHRIATRKEEVLYRLKRAVAECDNAVHHSIPDAILDAISYIQKEEK